MSRVTAPVSPRAAQTLRSAAHGLITGLGPRLRDLDIVHVELSGRALHQFYLAWALTVGPRRALLVLTCHDMPSLVGWPMLFAELERRPARRLAKLMSTTVGRRLERRLLARCDIAIALTEDGAEQLRQRADAAVSLPHVVDRTEPAAKERRVFVPGYVSEPAVVASLADVVHREADRTSAEWRLVVGSTDPQTREEIERLLTADSRRVVEFTGHEDEEGLLRQFDRAFLVVRPVGERHDNACAASGPLCWALSRGCLVLTDDGRSGARELAAQSLLTLSSSLADDLSSVLGLWPDASGVVTRVESTQRVLGVAAVAALYGEMLEAAELRRSSRSNT